jgi:hypothetical protein
MSQDAGDTGLDVGAQAILLSVKIDKLHQSAPLLLLSHSNMRTSPAADA